jgi:hypothetical protein
MRAIAETFLTWNIIAGALSGPGIAIAKITLAMMGG